jgi:hypothetical protein
LQIFSNSTYTLKNSKSTAHKSLARKKQRIRVKKKTQNRKWSPVTRLFFLTKLLNFIHSKTWKNGVSCEKKPQIRGKETHTGISWVYLFLWIKNKYKFYFCFLLRLTTLTNYLQFNVQIIFEVHNFFFWKTTFFVHFLCTFIYPQSALILFFFYNSSEAR